MPREAIVSDIVLGKGLTPLLQAAKKAGFEILDGIPMVINQGVEAFWLLHGKELQAKNITKEQNSRCYEASRRFLITGIFYLKMPFRSMT